MMLDAIKGDMQDDLDEDNEQFEKDAKLNHVAKQGEFNELTIVATALVLLVAGYDTTGSTLSFLCYQLAKNPEIQDRLRAEIQEVTGDSDEEVTYDHLSKMTYMDQIISETLRFHTPLSALQRVASNDYKLPGSDLIIEKEMGVWINTMAIHFDTKHYSNPNVFDPEHFNKEAKAARHPYAFLPFGQGPRGCIGMRFALLEAKLALANIVRKFVLLPSEKTKEPLELDPHASIAYVKNGLYVKAEKLQ
jgi:cytochrome P450 family 6